MRKIVYDVTTTLGNFIAHEDGSTEGEHGPDYLARLTGYDTVVMGRKTYEFGYSFGLVQGKRGPLYPHIRHFIFSKSLRFGPDAEADVINRDKAACARRLKEEGGTDIYLCGGGTVAGFLLDQGLIDQLVLELNSLVFGRGIRLFGGSTRRIDLALVSSKAYGNGVLLLRYDVKY